MAKVTGIRLGRAIRQSKRGGGGRLMRSDNLRAPPRWITPEMVRQIVSLTMPADAKAMPVIQVPTPGVKPRLAIVPKTNSNPSVASTHSGRSEEREAVDRGPTSAASPRRSYKSMAERAAEFEAARSPVPSGAKGLRGRVAGSAAGRDSWVRRRKAEASAKIEANRPLFQIAFDRGIALVDLAHALQMPVPTALVHTKKAGFQFGKRAPLADPLTRDVLLTLADQAIPLPELRSARLYRERLEREARTRRERREQQRKGDLSFRPLGPRASSIREVERPAPRQAAEPSPSREPAFPAERQARAQSSRELTNARISAGIRRSIEHKAAALLDSDQSALTTGGRVNQVVRAAANELLQRRAAAARQTDPVERAKLILQRRYTPVCSMAVYGGAADRFIVGARKNLTCDELLEMAERFAA